MSARLFWNWLVCVCGAKLYSSQSNGRNFLTFIQFTHRTQNNCAPKVINFIVRYKLLWTRKTVKLHTFYNTIKILAINFRCVLKKVHSQLHHAPANENYLRMKINSWQCTLCPQRIVSWVILSRWRDDVTKGGARNEICVLWWLSFNNTTTMSSLKLYVMMVKSVSRLPTCRGEELSTLSIPSPPAPPPPRMADKIFRPIARILAQGDVETPCEKIGGKCQVVAIAFNNMEIIFFI